MKRRVMLDGVHVEGFMHGEAGSGWDDSVVHTLAPIPGRQHERVYIAGTPQDWSYRIGPMVYVYRGHVDVT
jgi:hypothetical protein